MLNMKRKEVINNLMIILNWSSLVNKKIINIEIANTF